MEGYMENISNTDIGLGQYRNEHCDHPTLRVFFKKKCRDRSYYGEGGGGATKR